MLTGGKGPRILTPLMVTGVAYLVTMQNIVYTIVIVHIFVFKGVVYTLVWTQQKIWYDSGLAKRCSSQADIKAWWFHEKQTTSIARLKSRDQEEEDFDGNEVCGSDMSDEKYIDCKEGASEELADSSAATKEDGASSVDITLREVSSWFGVNSSSTALSVFRLSMGIGTLLITALFQLSLMLGGPFYRRRPASLMKLYCHFPLKFLSRQWGEMNRRIVPVAWRKPFYTLYCTLFGVKVEEAENTDLTSYPNLCALFQRNLKASLRPISSNILTSPADGRVLHAGPVNDDVLEQVKGVHYAVDAFFGPTELPNQHNQLQSNCDCNTDNTQEVDCDTEELKPSDLLLNPENRLYQCIIYLAPGDYHRFHSPADWVVESRRHFPGELFSVQPGIARWMKGLFTFNERAVYRGRWRHGFFSMTPVGAVNVGSIRVFFDEELETNTQASFEKGSFQQLDFPQGHTLTKGERIGDFNLGSTIVLIFEAPDDFCFTVTPGCKVQYGQALGTM